jgi:hypothetical protein
VDLPSQGRFYAQGHPLHGQDSIEIKQMTAKEEDILTSRTLLKKGVALDKLIESLIVNKAINPSTLLIGDRATQSLLLLESLAMVMITKPVFNALLVKQSKTMDLI